MRVASYVVNQSEAFGVLTPEGAITLSGRVPRQFRTLRDVLAAGALDTLRDAAKGLLPDIALADLRFLPTVTNPDKILCVGVNYRSHATETGRELPPKPSIFARLNNTLLNHGGNMIRPRVSQHFDYEGELAVIIGRGGHYIPIERALDHVAGYSCFNDGSIRDYQKNSVTAGKNFPASGPLGPWMTTCDDIPDPSKLKLTTRLNGKIVQESGTDMLIYSIPQIISYVSEFTILEPGDIIATGTPEGVGARRSPPLWMKAGDEIEVEISEIGILRNHIIDEVF